MNKGVLLFAHDNQAFPYHRLVPIVTWFVKMHLNVPVALVTDEITKERLDNIPGSHLVDDIQLVGHRENNARRVYQNSNGTEKEVGVFKNKSRTNIYDLTPFDETIFMDLDYLVMNDSLNRVWGSDAPVRMNYRMEALRANHLNNEQYLSSWGIPMYWSTVLYFRKCPEAEVMFHGLQEIKKQYRFYADLYGFPHQMFRNDIALSIAAHCMNDGVGPQGVQHSVRALPEPELLFAWEDQPLLQAEGDRMWFVGSTENKRKSHVSYTKGQSVHVVNKHSILDVMEPIVRGHLN